MSIVMCEVDAGALQRAIGHASPEWYGDAFARSYYRAVGGGRLRVDNLDKIAVALGCHYTELLADGEVDRLMIPELSKQPVLLDPEAVERLSEGRSFFPTLYQQSDMSRAQFEGRYPVPLWKVESLAVLVGCLPAVLIKQDKEEALKSTATAAATPPKVDKRTQVGHCAYCDKEVKGVAGRLAHEKACKENPKNQPKVETIPELQDPRFISESHCPHVEECNAEPTMTDCGADPCDLVHPIEKDVDLEEKLRPYTQPVKSANVELVLYRERVKAEMERIVGELEEECRRERLSFRAGYHIGSFTRTVFTAPIEFCRGIAEGVSR